MTWVAPKSLNGQYADKRKEKARGKEGSLPMNEDTEMVGDLATLIRALLRLLHEFI